MRFGEYIKEAYRSMDIMTSMNASKRIHKDCKPYLKLLGKREPLRRGMNEGSQYGSILFKKKVRKDRRARIGGANEAKFLNELLEKYGHIRRDKSVMANNRSTATFGQQYYIFPIGKFNYTWVRAEDWNFSYDKTGWRKPGTGWRDSELEIEEDFKRQHDMDNIVTNKGFNTAHKMEYEIWMDCKEYYFMPLHVENIKGVVSGKF